MPSLPPGQSAAAIVDYAGIVALEKRLDAQLRVQLVPNAMLPDPTVDANTVPTAPTFASLLAWSRLGANLAVAYLASHQPADAQAQYTAVRAYLANWPATARSVQRETMNVWSISRGARLGQAEAAHAARDDQAALQILENEGWPGDLPAALDARRKQLADQLHGNQNTRTWQDVQQQMNQSPTQLRTQSLQQQIAALQKQRDTMAADLDAPNLSPRERQIRQSSAEPEASTR